MATEIRVPTLGESVSEATIGKWFKQAGDAVKADEPLVELETDKVTLEVNAPAAGVLSEIAAKDGETVGVGALLGQIDAEGAGTKSEGGTKKGGGAKAEAPKPGGKVDGGKPEVVKAEPGKAEPAKAPASKTSTDGAGNSTPILVPTLGESVSEATVGRWFKKPGDAVKADEALLELETDKVTLEVNAPAAGVLAEVTVADGETVSPGAVLGQIGAASGAAPAAEAPKPAATAAPPARPAMPPAPAAAKIAAERGVDLAGVEGSGKRGQVLKGDVLVAATRPSRTEPAAERPSTPSPAPVARRAPSPADVLVAPTSPTRTEPTAERPSTPSPAPVARRAPSPADDAAREERVRMTKLRQTIARRLKDAQNSAAMLTTFNEVDMSGVMGLRARYKDVFEKKHGAKLGFMGLFVKAVVGALKELPAVNAEIDGTDIVYKNYYHIGIAVGTDKGLVVPVVRDADQLDLAGIEKTIADFGRRARDGALKIDEMQGGTFTVTNGGIYGSLMSTPILNAPQSGILGMHKIQERPVVVAGKVEVRPMMYLALSYDHRIVDGREAVTFLVRVKEALEDPARLILDV